jgi:hypothetical protein
MGGTRSTNERDKKFIQKFGRKPEGKRPHSEDLGVDGEIILSWILNENDEGELSKIGTSGGELL